jgi:hypothetical protein
VGNIYWFILGILGILIRQINLRDASWLSEISVADVVQQIMSSWGQDFSIILAQMMSRLLIYFSKPKEQMNFDPINMNKSPPLVQ